MPEIIQINPNTWRIEDGGVRFFLLTGTQSALLIDSGMTVHDAREIAESLTSLPVKLLNTHADRDHTGSNEEFDEFYMHPDEWDNYSRSGKSGKPIPVHEGDVLDLGGRALEIIDLPGHTPGSIAVLDRAARVLISGDPIQTGNIFMFGSHRNLENYVKSLEALEENHAGQFDEIWPSHASFPVSPTIIPALIDGAKRILAGELKGEPTDMHGQQIMRCDAGVAGFLVDLR